MAKHSINRFFYVTLSTNPFSYEQEKDFMKTSSSSNLFRYRDKVVWKKIIILRKAIRVHLATKSIFLECANTQVSPGISALGPNSFSYKVLQKNFFFMLFQKYLKWSHCRSKLEWCRHFLNGKKMISAWKTHKIDWCP